MFLLEWCEFPSAPCLAGKETWWQLESRCSWNRARPCHASELVSFLVGLRTYQHPCTISYISTTSRRELSSSYFPAKQGAEGNAILAQTLARFLPGRDKDLSAPRYQLPFSDSPTYRSLNATVALSDNCHQEFIPPLSSKYNNTLQYRHTCWLKHTAI